jgi:Fe-S-cluster containining protein
MMADHEVKAPCLERGCHECCVATEMPLSQEDIQRLVAMGHDPEAFAVTGDDGYVFLANVDGQCYFLNSEGMCTVYEDRPEGCRLYPLVLDEALSEFVMDPLCPHSAAVEVSDRERDAILELLDRLAHQRGNTTTAGMRNP